MSRATSNSPDGEARQVGNLAKLVCLDAIGLTLVCDWCVCASPARDGGKSIGGRRRCRSAGIQNDRLAERAPVEAACGDSAAGGANPLADGEIGMVAFQTRRSASVQVPQLRVAGIEIDVHLSTEFALERVRGQVAGDIDQQIGVARQVVQFGCGRSVNRRSLERPCRIADERCARLRPKVAQNAIEIIAIDAPVQPGRRPLGIDERVAANLLEKEHVCAEPREPFDPVEHHARIAAVVGLVRDHAAHDDQRLHAGTTGVPARRS